MNAASDSSDISNEPVITTEGRFFRVSVIRQGRIESYLCETEAQAKHFAQLLAQPVVDPKKPAASTPPARTSGQTARQPTLSLVRTGTLSWKGRP